MPLSTSERAVLAPFPEHGGVGRILQSRLALPIASFGGTLAAVGLYVAYIVQFGINVPHWDDWSTVQLLATYKNGDLNFSQLWAQHNESRLLIPNTISVILGNLSHLNLKLEMYVGAFFLALGVFALVAAIRGLTNRRWFVYAPAVIPIFMPVQWQSSLWGYEFAWFFTVACLGCCVYALCRSRSNFGLVLAIALATAASFSLLQGLFIWPTASILLWAGRRSRSWKTTWILSGILVWFLYFWNFKFNESGDNGARLSFVLRHPFQDARYFLTALGNFALGWGGATVAQLLGLGMLMLGLIVIARYIFSDRTLVRSVPVVLVSFAFLFDLSLAEGRSGGGYGEALRPRYITYNLLIFVAVYFAIVEREPWARLAVLRKSRVFFISGAGALAVLLFAVSATTAVTQGRVLAAQLRASQLVLVNYRVDSNALIGEALTIAPPEANILQVRALAPFLEQQRDSVFADPSLVASLRAGHSSFPTRLLPGFLMPVSPAIGMAMSSPRLRHAWVILSTVYGSQPNLQRAFPLTSPELDGNILGWAARYGATSADPGRALLRPELPSLRKLYLTTRHSRR